VKSDPHERLLRARESLEGLSVGDAFGDRYFVDTNIVASVIRKRALIAPPWVYSDDTEMALSVYASLRRFGNVDQDFLANNFAARYSPSRGYGPAMHGLLHQIRLTVPWRAAAKQLFGGEGSFGNGAAMRVAPIGAYFADDVEAAVLNARLSAEVTHAHPEAAAGAIAVAVAAALAYRLRDAAVPEPPEFLELVRLHVPDSVVREKLRHAGNLAPGCSVELAVSALGNGTQISAQDTVPFTLWCASRHLDNFEEALWLTVSGLGDRDTTCAIVGGVVASCTGLEGIPSQWRASREPLPEWPFEDV